MGSVGGKAMLHGHHRPCAKGASVIYSRDATYNMRLPSFLPNLHLFFFHTDQTHACKKAPSTSRQLATWEWTAAAACLTASVGSWTGLSPWFIFPSIGIWLLHTLEEVMVLYGGLSTLPLSLHPKIPGLNMTIQYISSAFINTLEKKTMLRCSTVLCHVFHSNFHLGTAVYLSFVWVGDSAQSQDWELKWSGLHLYIKKWGNLSMEHA